MSYIYLDNLFSKFKLYGPINFIKFSIIEIFRIILRTFFSSFSQFREDLIIEKYLNKSKNVSYIDIGSNHPVKFNNTYRFYLKGGRGINIEPDGVLISFYKKLRPKDINLEVGVSDHSSFLIFYRLLPDVSSTFSRIQAEREIKSGNKFLSKEKVKVITLKNIFEKYLHAKYVDLISIDTEGFDLKVLKGNNWTRYRSKIICVENFEPKVRSFLKNVGYRQIYSNQVNSIYISE